MKDIFEALKKMDKSQLKNAVKQAKAFIKTPEGKDLAQKVKDGSVNDSIKKDDIVKELGKNPEVAKFISDIFNSEG